MALDYLSKQRETGNCFRWGRGSGLMVSIQSFYSDDLSSWPVEVYSFMLQMCTKTNKEGSLFCLMCTVWPDAEIKSSPNVSKSSPRCSQKNFTRKRLFFKIAQKSLYIWATFDPNIFTQNFKNSPNLVTLDVYPVLLQLLSHRGALEVVYSWAFWSGAPRVTLTKYFCNFLRQF